MNATEHKKSYLRAPDEMPFSIVKNAKELQRQLYNSIFALFKIFHTQIVVMYVIMSIVTSSIMKQCKSTKPKISPPQTLPGHLFKGNPGPEWLATALNRYEAHRLC